MALGDGVGAGWGPAASPPACLLGDPTAQLEAAWPGRAAGGMLPSHTCVCGFSDGVKAVSQKPTLLNVKT